MVLAGLNICEPVGQGDGELLLKTLLLCYSRYHPNKFQKSGSWIHFYNWLWYIFSCLSFEVPCGCISKFFSIWFENLWHCLILTPLPRLLAAIMITWWPGRSLELASELRIKAQGELPRRAHKKMSNLLFQKKAVLLSIDRQTDLERIYEFGLCQLLQMYVKSCPSV